MVPVPTEPDFVHPGGIRSIDPDTSVHLRAAQISVYPPRRSTGCGRIGIGLAEEIFAVDRVVVIDVIIDFSDNIVRTADVIQRNGNVLRPG